MFGSTPFYSSLRARDDGDRKVVSFSWVSWTSAYFLLVVLVGYFHVGFSAYVFFHEVKAKDLQSAIPRLG